MRTRGAHMMITVVYRQLSRNGLASILLVLLTTAISPKLLAQGDSGSADFERCANLFPPALLRESTLSRLPTNKLSAITFRIADCARSQVVLDVEDNSPIIRAALEPLVTELGRRQADLGILEKLARTTGVWVNVWSDQPFIPAFADSLYQVFTPEGYYYNISKFPSRFDDRAVTTGLQRGQYSINDNGNLDIFFDANFSVEGFPKAGTPVSPLASAAQSGVLDSFRIPLSFTSPNVENDIIVGGELITVYVDDTLRVIRGKQTVPFPQDTLFVLLKQETITDQIRFRYFWRSW